MSGVTTTFWDGVRTVYNRTVRPMTPRKVGYFNGVPVKKMRLLDRTTEAPDYEARLIDRVKAMVEPGDDVGIVGGGRGVSAVWAARCGGTVTVYEAASENVSLIRETAELSDEAENITVEHALIGEDVDVWGDANRADKIEPASLPDFDVLVLDCEGSEKSIVPEATAERLVVETHNWLGSPASLVKSQLEDRGYEIVDERVDLPEYNNKIISAKRA